MPLDTDLNKILEKDGWKVIASKVSLARKGDKFLGLCPFHNEKTPSFNVMDNGLYYCFGCKNKGNAITFLLKEFGFTKSEAIKYISQLLCVDLKFGAKRDISFANSITEINILASTFYSKKLLDEYKEYKEYLYRRGYNEEYIRKYKIGFAPKNNALLKYMKSEMGNDVDYNSLLESNLIKIREDKEYHDFFQDRIIWPIYDHTSSLVAFSGRVVDDTTNAPKYLNIGNNTLYQKHSVLYGLDKAKSEMLKKQCLIIVEGYTDVDILYINGIENVVATCGTALCKEHITTLLSVNQGEIMPLIIVFDGDIAGRQGVYKIYKLFKDLRWFDVISHIDVLLLEDGMDPCDFVLKRGGNSLKELLSKKTMPITSFVIKDMVNTSIYLSRTIKNRRIINNIRLFLEELPSNLLVGDFLEEFTTCFPMLKTQILNACSKYLDISVGDQIEKKNLDLY